MSESAPPAAPAISVRGLTKRYGDNTVLDRIDFDLPAQTICGLFGRNGAGKTTLMRLATAQEFATAGTVRIFGEEPYENPAALSRMCFIRENQKYPDDAKPSHVFATAKLFFPHWSDELAADLAEEFDLPVDTRIKKLSRGQFSAVGVIVGLASRAEITFFDEPYLGLDAVARQVFYDHLLADYAEFPRTIVLSSHLIDEIADLLERVLVIDSGSVVLDEDADTLRSRAVTVVGDAVAVDEFIRGREELHRERLGPVASVTVSGTLDEADRRRLTAAGLTTAPVSLQELTVRLWQRAARDHDLTGVSR